MPRPLNCRRIDYEPEEIFFRPEKKISHQNRDHIFDKIILGFDELEAMRLADFEGLSMRAASEKMGISRHTFGRLLNKAHHKVAKALCLQKYLQIAGGNCAYNRSFDTNNLLNNNINKEGFASMNESSQNSVLVAVPSEAPGGLTAKPSAHFGHCAFYTVAEIEDKEIKDVRILPNGGHEHGGCVQPVHELAKDGVTVLLAGGMGMKPLQAMQQAGIKVFYCVNQLTVEDALKAFAAGKLQAFGSEQLCTGCSGHH